jgi:hypothetical protein
MFSPATPIAATLLTTKVEFIGLDFTRKLLTVLQDRAASQFL